MGEKDSFRSDTNYSSSVVRSSTFRVKDKDGIEDPKCSLRMLFSPNNCQFGSKFWIRPYEADGFLEIRI
jgi:hypothetical protein